MLKKLPEAVGRLNFQEFSDAPAQNSPFQEFDFDMESMADSAELATDFLKAIAHEGRLMILCRLAEGECSVTEFEDLLSHGRQLFRSNWPGCGWKASLGTRRDGKSVYYFLADERVKRIIPVLYELFCAPNELIPASPLTSGLLGTLHQDVYQLPGRTAWRI